MSKQGNESLQLLQAFRQEKITGRIVKRFQDEYFALDLLKILYDDTVDRLIKTELLIVLEEYGCLSINSDSVDQMVTSLLDIYNQAVDNPDNWTFVCQALVTSTSLLVQLEQVDSDVCVQLIKELVSVVTSRVNQPDSQRLRSCACQCLLQMEDFHPGLLFAYHDDFARLARQERTHVFQDYALLATKVTEAVKLMTEDGNLKETDGNTGSPRSPTQQLMKPTQYQKQMSYEVQDLRQMAAFIVESIPLLTRCVSYRIIQSLVDLVKHLPEISPMIFKPLMLHQMSTMSCVLFHTVLYIQREFEGEILTKKEEADVINRLCLLTDQPCLTTLHKLLVNQWVQMYQLDENGKPVLHDNILRKFRLKFYPTVFDPVDCQLSKLYMTSLCGDTSDDLEGLETSILLGSLGCLHKLVWHTGSGRAAIALFKALYFMYLSHNNHSFSQDIQRFVRGLISEFPHFIPHSIDFINSIHSLNINSKIYVETLSLIHQQIVMATEEQVCHSNSYYLQIMKKAALEKEIGQHTTLKFLQYLAELAPRIDDSSWKLGHGILEICSNLLMCHSTEQYYIEIGDLLYYMMTEYEDTDVQDKARFYYALMTNASDTKLHTVLQDSMGNVDSMTQTLKTLLPGVNDKTNLAKIISLEEPVFDWERVSVCPSYNTSDEGDKVLTLPESGSEDLHGYLDHLHHLDVTVDLKCRLSLNESSVFDQVHAVTVQVDSTDNYARVKDICVPCLSKSDHHEIVMKLKPQFPLPQTFCSQIMFACNKKQTYRVKLPNIDVAFCDVMMPLPWKPSTVSVEKFYREMCEWILSRPQKDRKAFESVKLFDVTPEQFVLIHQNHLSPYHLGNQADFKDSFYAIFFPPQHHVLLHCRGQQSNRMVISVVMDTYTVLPHVDNFLESVINS